MKDYTKTLKNRWPDITWESQVENVGGEMIRTYRGYLGDKFIGFHADNENPTSNHIRVTGIEESVNKLREA